MKTNQAWGGRFSAGPAEEVASFTDSQSYDRALYEQDIRASMAHAAMLGKQGIISQEEADQIQAGLERVHREIESGIFAWDAAFEDVHMNIEKRLTELIGEAGKKLHTARSRNDQVALTFRLFVSDSCEQWQKECVSLCRTLLEQARKNQNVIMPGFTHMQPAQPVSLAHHLLAYVWMFKRDVERIFNLLDRARVSPLGATALAGSTYPVDPRQIARSVGFRHILDNSMDAVSDRDFVLEALFCASLLMMHISRISEEIIIWSTPAFNFVKLPDAYATGSSIMPQKKNPDVAELARGKCGRVYGNLMALLTVMKGLPLAYNRDMQEDKEAFLDSDKTIRQTLRVMTGLISELSFNNDRMRAACKTGYLNATELADYLVSRGLPFRTAHHVTGKLVAEAEKRGLALEELSLAQMREIEPLIDDNVFAALDYEACISRRESPGGTGPQSVKRQIENLSFWLDSFDYAEEF